MLLEHERYKGLGMDALVIACSWNMNVIMVWAWISFPRKLLQPYPNTSWLAKLFNSRKCTFQGPKTKHAPLNVSMSTCGALRRTPVHDVSQTFADSQSTKGNRTAGCVQA